MYKKNERMKIKKYNLAIMSVEHELVDTIDFEYVINDFASQKARNVRF